MLKFISRRLAATFVVLIVASFVVYMLVALTSDPLRDLRVSNDQSAQHKMAILSEKLQLDVPPFFRYFLWLRGAAGCVIGQCDLGIAFSRGDQPVAAALGTAMASTLSLVVLATILAIVFGIAIGMTTALRQYSAYDYTVTFGAFIFYSLPIFWVAVLLKEFGAIKFNEFLGAPDIPLGVAIGLGLVFGFIAQAIVGGRLVARLKIAGAVAVLATILLVILDATQWFAQPSIGIIGVTLSVAGIAAFILFATSSMSKRRYVIAIGATAALVVALWFPLQFVWFFLNNPLTVILVALVLAVLGWLLGWFIGGDDRKDVARIAAIVGALATIPLLLDQLFIRWETYTNLSSLKSGVIATIGANTPTMASHPDTWLRMLDSAAHLVLPTIALMVISIAAYTRYTRATLLEVLNQDYVRTARAKGLNESTVVMRHAFRNTLIPIATIIAFDFGAIIGGAIITERVFAWQGMGSLFSYGLHHSDVNLVMGFFLVTGIATVAFNIVADITYSVLDPRIRLSEEA
ncbi:peptide/nickel transport system permease protein [Microbacteriaceae bacterium MWH-Ta3]|nr:peptide/nickel transport system permease protein [Microbacteriaceae bacterium MWH-Ta3]